MQKTTIERLRADLAASGFTAESLSSLWGAEAAQALHRGQRLPATRALAAAHGGGRLGTIATAFVLGLPVVADELDRSLPNLRTEGAVELGLVAVNGAIANPLVQLRPHSFVDALGTGSWWIVSDLGEMALGTAVAESHVLGVGGASTTLSGLLITDEVDRVLDLGTGCGILALHASRFATSVVATDISARALAFAELNATLNGVENIEFRLGSLFAPVAGEHFELIVSNPPFVITPRVEGVPVYEYRDGGLEGDALVETVVRQVADHLNPGGIAQLLGNWEYRSVGADRDGLERAGDWALGLDAWIVERESQDANLYAETWIRDGGTKPGTPEFEALYSSWLNDFSARDVAAVGFGYITLRATDSATPLRRLERLHGPTGRNGLGLGPTVATALRAQDWLATAGEDELLATSFTVAGDVTEERHYWPGDEHPTVIDVRQGGGFGRSIGVGTALAAVVGACDGDLSLGAICGAIAQLLEVDERALVAEVVPEVRELVFIGMLNP